ncbi:MAG TPA: M20 family metallo-hydrolase [Clostridia bacterium]|nr:M20 family metallo-hydrolase [Clostridia bacterium]
MDIQNIMDSIEKKRSRMVEDIVKMSSIPSINPKFNGTGEYERMKWLMGVLDDYSIAYEVYEVEDESVKEQKRLNIVVRLEGSEKTDDTLWFVSHMDTVAAGDIGAWNSDPFNPIIKSGKIYGRGVEDNGQAVICSLYTCLAMRENNIRPKCNVGFVFASDEETGSEFGLKALIKKGIFKPNDEAIVPDAGCHDGSFIEIAEKSMYWVKFTVSGKEAHASMPHLGINASSIASHFAVELEDLLKSMFSLKDDLFDPPYSTFEITQKYANVESPNVLPGKDVFVMDMRVLPQFKFDDIVTEIDKLAGKYEYKYKVKIAYEFTQKVVAPKPTPKDSKIVSRIYESISELGIKPRVGGIGGGTCAALLRDIGIPAVVWSTLDELAHQPNEYAVIDNLIRDTQVFISTVLKYM